MKRNKNLQKLILAAFFLALGVVLPMVVGHLIPMGWTLLPMHIPALISGFVLGGPWGAVVGVILPGLNFLITGMPGFPGVINMTFELAAYGFFAGLLYNNLPKNKISIYVSLAGAMLLGRVVWAISSFITSNIFLLSEAPFGFSAFLAGGFASVWMGIVVQMIIIPIIVIILEPQINKFKDSTK